MQKLKFKISLSQFSVMTSQAGDFAEAAACAASMAGVNCASVVPKSTCRSTLEVITLGMNQAINFCVLAASPL